MSEFEEDPSANTGRFRAFVERGDDDGLPRRLPVSPAVLVTVGVVIVAIVIVVVALVAGGLGFLLGNHSKGSSTSRLGALASPADATPGLATPKSSTPASTGRTCSWP